MEITIQEANIRLHINQYGTLSITRLDNDTRIMVSEQGDGFHVTGEGLTFERGFTPAGWDCVLFRQRALSEPGFQPEKTRPLHEPNLTERGPMFRTVTVRTPEEVERRRRVAFLGSRSSLPFSGKSVSDLIREREAEDRSE